MTSRKQSNEVFVLIGNINLQKTQFSKVDYKNLYTGRNRMIGKQRVVITTLKSGEFHRSFLRQYLHKSPTQFLNFWKNRYLPVKARCQNPLRRPAGIFIPAVRVFDVILASNSRLYWYISCCRSPKTEKELLSYIVKTRGAIGYISLKTAQDNKQLMKNVKTLTVK